jgi:hypothetical protein
VAFVVIYDASVLYPNTRLGDERRGTSIRTLTASG